ncbi:D-tyrosyl-tRNA(Tyr) deacylase [Verticiella sediminum]|uniref:D-aminoacyl-tRNA deacylase n=1 Tax=Verticiella sediminum TaxID=1247510 RepID=A0A556AYL7_9BURK|nr:D-aminoacyl-tRNA deacylase [Verticiella sediminum]TSH98018.1 D-tyrosyl-tRNA(Tyr) deacylase [Verticiella sediminum]
MLGLLQRVARASVHVEGEEVGAIGRGILLLVCAEPDDGDAQVDQLFDKVVRLRIFPDDEGRMNRSLRDVDGGLLIVSQFTLAADTRRGTRPGFSRAAPPERARRLYDLLVQRARAQVSPVACGRFGADMQVSLVNDGPVTIPLQVGTRGGAAPAP